MLLRIKGTNLSGFEDVVTVTRRRDRQSNRSALLTDQLHLAKNSAMPILTTLAAKEFDSDAKVISGLKTLEHLSEGDIVHVAASGNVRTLFRVNSNQNFLLVTERCNSNCLMCSQPPMDRDDLDYFHSIHKKLIPLIPKDCREIGITGGEPTILGRRFFELLSILKSELPTTEVHILSNGRSFSIDAFAEKLGKLNYPNVMIGIPLYSDDYLTHDYVVQAKDAFIQTVSGIHNLKRYGVRVEIRVVLHKVTIPRLTKLAEYIYKNITFVDQVVFMGLEITGYTLPNLEELWIDPIDYMDELSTAVHYLSDRGINVGIYNSQFCLMPQDLWPYAKKSISDWKNIYFEECSSCDLLSRCGGLFVSATKKASPHIKAIKQVSISH